MRICIDFYENGLYYPLWSSNRIKFHFDESVYAVRAELRSTIRRVCATILPAS